MHCQVNQSNNIKILNKMTKKEIEDEIEMLKMLLKFHNEDKIVKDDREREKHIDAILDRISELIKMKEKN